MPYIQFYKDAACTQKWKSVPVIEVPYTTLFGTAGTIDGFSYRDNNVLDGVEVIKTNPFLSYTRMTDVQRYYCKNGLSIEFGMTATRSVFKNFKYGDTFLSFREMDYLNDDSNHPRYWAIGFTADDGKHYIGFTRVSEVNYFPDYIPVSCAFEDRFWESAFTAPYDYGNDPDGDGGQGSGTIDGTGVHRSTTPTGHVPTGGRGLHIYRITQAGYNSVQDYLWGEGSTLAKTLWQKFMNHNHNPANCIVGCFQLPQIFMPPRGASSGVQLGGVNLPTTGTFTTPHLYIDTPEYSLGTISPPFKSWLDYSGVTCKIAVPFCGEIPVPVEKVWDKEVTVQYRCDTFNGNFGAAVRAGGNMIADITGNAAYQIPIVAGDDGTLQRIGAAAAGVLGIVTAGSSAAAMTAAGTAAAGIAGAQYNTYCANSNTSGNAQSCINGVAYIEYIVPQTAKINSGTYNGAYGMPSCVSGTLSEFTGGYGEFDVSVQEVSSVWNATTEEKDEIVKLLEGGVFV